MSIEIGTFGPGVGAGGGGSDTLQDVVNRGNKVGVPGTNNIEFTDGAGNTNAINNSAVLLQSAGGAIMDITSAGYTIQDTTGDEVVANANGILVENGTNSTGITAAEILMEDSSGNATDITVAQVRVETNVSYLQMLISGANALITYFFGTGQSKTIDFSTVRPTAVRTITVKDASGLMALDPVINAQNGTSYTFLLTDDMNYVTGTNAATQTYTVPTNATTAFRVGATIQIFQLGAGKITVAGAGGVTVNSLAGNLSTNGQNVGVSLMKTATNTWLLCGNLQA